MSSQQQKRNMTPFSSQNFGSQSFMNMKTPEFGMDMKAPAAIALIGYIVMAIVILLPFEFPVYDEKTNETYVLKYSFVHRLITILLMAIPIALSVYSINCMMSGQCVVWSYIVSITTIIWIGMFVISAMIYTWKPKKDD